MIIGLCGYKGSGKSVAANYLIDRHGFESLNFKDALVKEMKESFPDLLIEMAEREGVEQIDDLFKEKPPLMRALMQNYGTEVRRKDNENYWVHRWMYEAEDNFKKNLVADDVRFVNEAKAIRDLGGIIIRIVREDIVEVDGHATETEHRNINEDFTIVAGLGEHDAVYGQIESVLSDLKAD